MIKNVKLYPKCINDSESIRIWYDPEGEIVITILNQSNDSILSRIWKAIKYVFKLDNPSEFGAVRIRDSDIPEIEKILTLRKNDINGIIVGSPNEIPEDDIEYDISDEQFNSLLIDVVGYKDVQAVLSVPGVYELLAEEYNNEVLARYRKLKINVKNIELRPFGDYNGKKVEKYCS